MRGKRANNEMVYDWIEVGILPVKKELSGMTKGIASAQAVAG